LLQDILRQPAELKRCLFGLTGPSRPALEEAAGLLRHAPRVQVVGIGSSWNAGMAVTSAFQRTGSCAGLFDASELLHFGALPAGSVALVLSRSGRTVEIVRLLEKLRAAGSRIVAVTNAPDSPLGRAADVVVPLQIAYDHLVSVVMYSSLLLGGLLIAARSQGDPLEAVVDRLAAALDEAEASLDGWRDQIESSGWLSGDAPTYFLARGPSLASAHEARLLWEEAAKMPAVVVSTGGFRHGSQEAVFPGTRVALWLDPMGQREDDLQLAADLRAAGAQVLLMGAEVGERHGDCVARVPSTPPGWQPLLDVMPAQLAAERLARMRNQDCDRFRYCPYVVEEEGGLGSGPGTMGPLVPREPDTAVVPSRQQGRTLEQPYYTAPSIFARDLDRIFFRHWLFAGHVSHIRNPGEYFLVELGGESLIVVRQADGEVRALHNVCRHRGSRICTQASGRARSFVCPYHRWAYRLDGTLAAAKHMPEDFDRTEFGLGRAHLRIFEGLIFVSLAPDPPPFESIEGDLLPQVRPHGLANAKICHTARYEIRANWKLVVENARECYHCPPAHPEYCRVMGFAAGVDSPRLAAEDAAITRERMAHWGGIGLETATVDFTETTLHHAIRMPFRNGCVSQSLDGMPVAPLMGGLPERDVGALAMVVFPTFWFEASGDYAMIQRLLPVSPEVTSVEMTWLVHEDAREGTDYDVARVTAFWKATAEQDRIICEGNQAGVSSRAYRPGPYSPIEGEVEKFVRWYLSELGAEPEA
jgi:Rieske 2Fe-2S family protein